MQTIRILFYTDHPDIDEDEFNYESIADLKRFILDKTKRLADVEITLVNRHKSLVTKMPAQGANKLSWGLLSNYDELWVFGYKQINRTGAVETVEPYNELDNYEIAVLTKWMDSGGGLMFTGDHSEANPEAPGLACAEPGRKSFQNLGRALGICMPRAKQLRVWEGPPTLCFDTDPDKRDNFNTQTPTGSSPNEDLDVLGLQLDGHPQTLVSISPRHQLFSYVNSNGELVPIDVLPDHAHEGKVLVPAALDDSWPANSPPPEVVARGTDKRQFTPPRVYDLVVAYDGHAANVGRIVADSSFHHFINRNLVGLNSRDGKDLPVPDTDLDKIAHYFTNLALWLAPQAIQHNIKRELPFRLAKHPDVLESRGGGKRKLGKAAQSVAALEWGASNLFQLFESTPFGTEPGNDLVSMAFSEASIPTDAEEVESADVLGGIITKYHELFRDEGIHTPGFLEQDPAPGEVLAEGIALAFRNQPQVVEAQLESFRESNFPGERGVRQSQISVDGATKEVVMGKCGNATWKSWLREVGGAPNDGEIDTNPVNANGDFTGQHRRLRFPIQPIIGKCLDNPDRIVISRIDGTDQHIYFGKITTVNTIDTVRIGEGRHRVTPIGPIVLADSDWDFSGSKLVTDDDWVAEKTAT